MSLNRSWTTVILLWIALVLRSSAVLASTPPSECDPNWSLHNGRCFRYYGYGSRTTYPYAQSICAGLGGNLASIHSSAENTFLHNLGCGSYTCWIGGSVQNSAAYWIDGTSFNYGRFGSGHPYSASYYSFRMYNAQWYSSWSYSSYGFACAKEAQCPAGSYAATSYDGATATAGTCVQCPAGTYNSNAGGVGVSSCTSCPAGRYGVAGETSSTCTGPCPQGKYCTGGTAQGAETNCPAGTYGASAGASSASQCSPCTAGYFCNPGSTSATESPCEAGVCGYESQSTESCSQPCPGGYYCPQGSACPSDSPVSGVTYARECGGVEFWCPAGSSEPLGVSSGFYTTGNTATTRNSQVQCEPGRYCVAGIANDCPAGTYSSAIGAVSATTCQDCDQGYYCPAASTNSRQQDCAAASESFPERFYCPQGTEAPIEVLNNDLYTYPDSDSDKYNRYAAYDCGDNYACVNGIRSYRISLSGCSNKNIAEEVDNANVASARNILTLGASIAGNNPGSWSTPVIEEYSNLIFYNNKPECSPVGGGPEKNEGIFQLNAGSGVVSLAAGQKLNYEVCPPQTTVRYRMFLRAKSTQSGTGIVAYRYCNPYITVSDVNDSPVVETSVAYRQIYEKPALNTAVSRCDGEGIVFGCPVGAPETGNAGIVATDEDMSSTLSWAIVGGADRSGDSSNWNFKIDSCSGVLSVIKDQALAYDPDVPANNVKHLQVQALDDGSGGRFSTKGSSVIDVYIYIINVNDPPVLPRETSGSPTFTVKELGAVGQELVPAMVVADDDDNDAITYTLVRDSDGFFELVGGKLQTTALGAATIDFESGTRSYTIEVQASDGNGGIDSATYTINVLNANDPPVFLSSGPYYIAEGLASNSDVCASSTGTCSDSVENRISVFDPDGGANDVTFSLDSTTYFTIASNGRIRTNQVLEFEDDSLSAFGGTGRGISITVKASSSGAAIDNVVRESQIDVLIYIVNVNEQPYLPTATEMLPDVLEILENWPVNVPIETSVLGTDPDNVEMLEGGTSQTLVYEVTTVGSPFEALTPSSTTPSENFAQFSLLRPINFESQTSWSVTLKATDNGGPTRRFSSRTYSISVIDVNEAPVFTTSNIELEINENEPDNVDIDIGSPIQATDPDTGDQNLVTYQVVGGSGVSVFGIRSISNGRFQVFKKAGSGILNFEDGNTIFDLLVRASDVGPPSSPGTLCETEQDCGEGVTCTAGRCFEICAPPSPRIHTYFCDQPAEVARVPETAEKVVRIRVKDVNDDPVVVGDRDSSNQIIEPCQLIRSALVGKYGSTQTCLGSMLTNTIDDDLGVGVVASPGYFTYSFVPSPAPAAFPSASPIIATSEFNLNSQTGEVTLDSIPTPTPATPPAGFAVGKQFYGRLVADDGSGGQGSCDLVILVKDDNSPPVLPDRTVTVNENLAPDTVVLAEIAPLSSIDVEYDPGAVPPRLLFFSMTQTSNFNLDPLTGQLTVGSASLDYETAPNNGKYILVVQVVDSDGAEDVATITVNVNDINEAPSFSDSFSGIIQVNEGLASGTTFNPDFSGLVSDPDVGDSLSFSLSGCGANCPFEVAGNRLRYVGTGPLDFEAAVNSWDFSVIASDGSLTDTKAVRVEVLNVNEAPVFAPGQSVNIPEDTLVGNIVIELSSLVNDEDAGDNEKLEFSIEGTLPSQFSMAGTSGVIKVAQPLDYETKQSYTLSVRVEDEGGLFVIEDVVINVINVNDVTVTSVSPPILSCGGGDTVTLTGTNFGLVSGGATPQLVVTYKAAASAVTYTAQGCTVTNSNTEIQCTSVAGVGNNLQWTVQVTVPGTAINGDRRTSTSTNKYPAPEITGITGASALATAGGDTVTITGNCLGEPGLPITFSRNQNTNTRSYVAYCFAGKCYFPTDCQVSATNEIQCVSVAGVGAALQWVVRVEAQLTAELYLGGTAYMAPVITGTNMESFPTTGVFPARDCCQVCVNFGKKACGDSCVATTFSCSEPAGCACTNAEEKVKFVITGEDFGDSNNPVERVYSTLTYTAIVYDEDLDDFVEEVQTTEYDFRGCTVTKNNEEVTCTSVDAGVGANMPLKVVFGGQSNDDSTLIRFDTPEIVSIGGEGASDASTSGGQSVTFTGRNFGPPCGTIGGDESELDATSSSCAQVRASYTRRSRRSNNELIVYVPKCAVVGQELLVCVLLEGTGRGHEWTILVGEQPTLGTDLFTTSYAAPSVGAYDGPGSSNAMTEGDQYVYLVGANFGPVNGAPIVAYYGEQDGDRDEFQAAQCQVVLSNERIRCKTSPGAGLGLTWSLFVDDQSSSTETTYYGRPELLGFSGPGTLASVDGGELVTITGANFGPSGGAIMLGPYLESVTYGPADTPFAYTADCSVVSHTQLRCYTRPGIGSNLVWQARVKKQYSTFSSVQTNYRGPRVVGISVLSSSTEGGITLRLNGTQLGLCDPFATPTVLFGGNPLSVIARYAGGRPLACPVQLNRPENVYRQIDVVVPPMTLKRKVGVSYRATSTRLMNPVESPLNEAIQFTYNPPSIDDVFSEPSVDITRLLVTVIGKNFCVSEQCCRTYLNGGAVPTASVVFHSHKKIQFLSTSVGSVEVTCEDVTSNAVSFLNKNPHVLSSQPLLDSLLFPTTGNDVVKIFGIYFGSVTPTVTVGGRVATVDNHLAIPCATGLPATTEPLIGAESALCWETTIRVPPGQGILQPVVVSNLAQNSFADNPQFELLNYLPPTIGQATGGVLSGGIPSTGSSSEVVLQGSNFGVEGTIWLGRVGAGGVEVPVSRVVEYSHTRIRFTVPPGEGGNLLIIIDAGGQTSEGRGISPRVSYLRPVIAEITSLGPYPTNGGGVLTIEGSNFGRAYSDSLLCVTELCTSTPPLITLGSEIICAVISSTASRIDCEVPQGAGKDLDITVEVGAQVVVARGAFSYSPPRIDGLNPYVLLSTSGYDTATGDRVLLTLVGENFGVEGTCVELAGDPVAVSPLASGEYPACIKDKNGDDVPRIVGGQTHEMVQLYAPEYHGKDIPLAVNVGGQVSNFLNISYAAPLVTNITVQGTPWSPLSEQQELGSCAFCIPKSTSDTPGNETLPTSNVVGYGTWEHLDGDECLLGANNSPLDGWSYRRYLEILPDGTMTQRDTWFDDPYCTSIAYRVGYKGVLAHIGSHDVVQCAQVYDRVVNEVSVELFTEAVKDSFSEHCPCDIWSVGGVRMYSDLGCFANEQPGCKANFNMVTKKTQGVYMIVGTNELYMSKTVEDTIFGRTGFSMPDKPSAISANTRSSTAGETPHGPTEGCFEWEDMFDFRRRQSLVADYFEVHRRCLRKALVTISGANFGADRPGLNAGLRVLFVNGETGEEFEAATTSTQGDHSEVCSKEDGCEHEHTTVTFQVPPGYGRNLRIRVQVGLGEQAQVAPGPEPLFHYDGPVLLEAVPGTVNRKRGFLDANGETVVLKGTNFGGSPSPSDILIGGLACQNTTWASGTTDDEGLPYLLCKSQRDVVGPKKVFVCVASQAAASTVVRRDATNLVTGEQSGLWDREVDSGYFEQQVLSFVNSQCQTSEDGTRYYARMYELCVPCPAGSDCERQQVSKFGSFEPPESDPGFYRFALPTRDEEGNVPERTAARCPRETWDDTLVEGFDFIVARPQCFEFVRCEPEEACLGDNQCNLGYQYAYPLCQNKRFGYKFDKDGNRLPDDAEAIEEASKTSNNTCRVYSDIHTGEWIGVRDDCNPSGEACTFQNPEECAQCVVQFDQSTNTLEDMNPTGICECEQPVRCALCSLGTHFRLNNECEKCPDNPGLLIAGFVIGVIVLLAGGFYLQRKNFNLAFISIGVDYFQVLSLFASTKIAWPRIMLDFFNFMTLFNFNIDITAPECLVPNLEYEAKWYMAEAIPIAAAGILLVGHACYVVFRRYRRGGSMDWTGHFASLVASYVTMFYYLYLSVTKKALDVFNCNPTEPDDGFLYTTFTSLTCEGGLCRCNEEGGVQQRLVPFAWIALLAYSFGFPLFVGFTIYKNKRKMMEDQYLRAQDLGHDRLTNPHAFDIRKKYHKLYYHFKPDKVYWIFYILNRKFWIAFSGLMFRGNPSFQLAVVLLVLFWAYVMQVVNRPFMSTGERMSVQRELDQKCKDALVNPKYSFYNEIQSTVQAGLKKRKNQQRKELAMRFERDDAEDILESKKWENKSRGLRVRARDYFFDYNTVEAVLLACSILVCLTGIMFESGRFESREDLIVQRDMITYVVICVIILSLVYYMLVIVSEVYQLNGTNACLRMLQKKKKEEVRLEDLDDDVVLDTNPYHAQNYHRNAAGVPAPGGEEDEKLVKKLREEVKRQKRLNQQQHAEASGVVGPSTGGKTKKLFSFGGSDEDE